MEEKDSLENHWDDLLRYFRYLDEESKHYIFNGLPEMEEDETLGCSDEG